MIPDIIPTAYQVFYILIPTISLIGNSIIVYVTIRSRLLRGPCNIFIALISFGDVLHMTGHFIMIISHNMSPTHKIGRNFCSNMQLLAIFGMFFSSWLLLSAALDRLMSLTTFYKFVILRHAKLYVTVQTSIAAIFAIIADIGVIFVPHDNDEVLCVITEPIQGVVYKFFGQSIMVINILIVICYAIFMCFIKRVRMSQDSMKHIYKSLIVISLTVVFGWFSTMAIVCVGDLLHIKIERFHVNLLAGLFVNFACATNFFVYYAISNEYRRIFDRYIFIGRFKRMIGVKEPSDAWTAGVDSRTG
ncbi:hypothetical protein V3C99_006926 [Haemonchus contortus]